jgi:hypothetical protein
MGVKESVLRQSPGPVTAHSLQDRDARQSTTLATSKCDNDLTNTQLRADCRTAIHACAPAGDAAIIAINRPMPPEILVIVKRM